MRLYKHLGASHDFEDRSMQDNQDAGDVAQISQNVSRQFGAFVRAMGLHRLDLICITGWDPVWIVGEK